MIFYTIQSLETWENALKTGFIILNKPFIKDQGEKAVWIKFELTENELLFLETKLIKQPSEDQSIRFVALEVPLSAVIKVNELNKKCN